MPNTLANNLDRKMLNIGKRRVSLEGRASLQGSQGKTHLLLHLWGGKMAGRRVALLAAV